MIIYFALLLFFLVHQPIVGMELVDERAEIKTDDSEFYCPSVLNYSGANNELYRKFVNAERTIKNLEKKL